MLKAVRVDLAYANLVLPAVIRHYQLTGRDAALATELASGTLRRRGTYDAILAACVERSLSKVEAKVLDALRLGTHQLLAMRVPDHAAIDTTVELVHAKVGPGAAGFANAVLRKVAAQDLETWIAEVAPDPRRRTPPGTPPWPTATPGGWSTSCGWRSAATSWAALLAADNVSPAVTLVARPGWSTREELSGVPTPYSPYGVVLPRAATRARSPPWQRDEPGSRTRDRSW